MVALYNHIWANTMPPAPSPLIPGIRAASRDLVRVWGFLNRTVAGTDLTGSAVHALVETGNSAGLSASDLCRRLNLEKSTVSRLVKSLVARGEIVEVTSSTDTRVKNLHLTDQGRRSLAAIDGFAEAQVSGALDRLDSRAQHRVLRGMTDYSAALTANSKLPAIPPLIRIESGHTPGLPGRILELSAILILRDHPFGPAFETRIARDLSEFLPRLTRAQNNIWYARSGTRIVGSITIDGEDLGNQVAHLRWFVLSDEHHGQGIGRDLLLHALDHCDRLGFKETHLWTLKGLDAARRLYEKNGFHVAEEFEGDQWGAPVTEQKLIRPHPDRR